MTKLDKKNDQHARYEFVWFRITVIVISLGYCTGEALLRLHL